MKFICFITLAICCFYSNCTVQAQCSLSDVFERIKRIDFQEPRSLTFKKYAAFDFERFLPIDDKTSAKEFEVGFSSTGEIREITYIGKSKFVTMYKLIVFDFKDYRISVLKHFKGDKFLFTPIALVTIKAKGENYAINFAKKFGTVEGCCGVSYDWKFPISDVNDISSVMKLDSRLFPILVVHLSSMQVVISSTIYYEKDNPSKLRDESMSFFLAQDFYTNLKINPGMCISEIFNVCDIPSDLVVGRVPNMHGFDETPMWVFGGSMDYKKCNQ